MENITAQTFYYFFELYLANVPDPITYEIQAGDVERLQLILHRLEYSPEDQTAAEYENFYLLRRIANKWWFTCRIFRPPGS